MNKASESVTAASSCGVQALDRGACGVVGLLPNHQNEKGVTHLRDIFPLSIHILSHCSTFRMFLIGTPQSCFVTVEHTFAELYSLDQTRFSPWIVQSCYILVYRISYTD